MVSAGGGAGGAGRGGAGRGGAGRGGAGRARARARESVQSGSTITQLGPRVVNCQRPVTSLYCIHSLYPAFVNICLSYSS